MINWYIIYVLQKDEDKIKKFLIDNGMNAFIPKRQVIYKRQGIKSLVSKSLFPNYVFVKSELNQRLFSSLLNGFKQEKSGIIRLLTYDQEGTPVLNDDERIFLEKLLDENNTLVPSSGYIDNQRVVIISGPLKGFESEIVAVNKHKDYAKLAVNLFGQKIIINVPLNVISKL